jgi:hypothetical protein
MASPKKREANKKGLGQMRLGGSRLVPKSFVPVTLMNVKTEADAMSQLREFANAGDPQAKTILDLLGRHSLNDLIVEGIVRLS